MRRLMSAAVAAFALAGPAYSQSLPPAFAGDEITAETVVDTAEMIRIADAIDAAVDAKDWDLTRGFFTDEIDVDFTSLTGGEPATIPADALIAGWRANLTETKTSLHIRGNHRIVFDGPDAARMQSHGYAWNRMETGALPENGGEPLWEVWGIYEHDFIRTEDGWRVSAMRFFATSERGNPYVRDTPG